MSRKKYEIPKRSCIVKTRLTEQERNEFEKKCVLLFHMGTQSIVIRESKGSLIGNNPNHIALHLNSGGDLVGILTMLLEELSAAVNFHLATERILAIVIVKYSYSIYCIYSGNTAFMWRNGQGFHRSCPRVSLYKQT